jgi:hypothetical protein
MEKNLVAKTGDILMAFFAVNIQGDQKVSLNLIITIHLAT